MLVQKCFEPGFQGLRECDAMSRIDISCDPGLHPGFRIGIKVKKLQDLTQLGSWIGEEPFT